MSPVSVPGCIIFEVSFQKEPELLTIQSRVVCFTAKMVKAKRIHRIEPRPQNTMATSYAAHGNSVRPSSFVPLGREIQNCQPTWRQRRSGNGNGKCLLCDAPHQLLMEL